jgi:hypothetical protein
MGTDIHIWVEAQTDNGWMDISTRAIKQKRVDLSTILTLPTEDQQAKIFEYFAGNPENRNYMVFAYLADVRNGYGFAGCEIFNPIEPCFEGRGYPNNTSIDTDLCNHSPTHFTVDEILKHKGWEQPIKEIGCVEYGHWKEFIDSQKTDNPLSAPMTYCGSVSGGDTSITHANRFESIDPQSEDIKNIYIKGSWTVQNPLKDTNFFKWLQGEEMASLIEQYGEENLRIIVNFDS